MGPLIGTCAGIRRGQAGEILSQTVVGVDDDEYMLMSVTYLRFDVVLHILDELSVRLLRPTIAAPAAPGAHLSTLPNGVSFVSRKKNPGAPGIAPPLLAQGCSTDRFLPPPSTP